MTVKIELEKSTGKYFHTDPQATPKTVELPPLPPQANYQAMEAAVRGLSRRMSAKE